MNFVAWFGLFLVLVVIGVALREQSDNALNPDGLDKGRGPTLEDSSAPKMSAQRQLVFPVESDIAFDTEALRSLKPGQFFSLAKEGGGGSAERFQIRVTEADETTELTQIRGVVQGGGQVIVTLSSSLTQIFLTAPSGAWRFIGDDFDGELTPSKSVGLDNDIRRPTLGERKASETKAPPAPASRG